MNVSQDTQRKMLNVSASPHIKSPIITTSIMLDVIIAMFPALLWSIYIFGLRALTITAISVISCIIFEAAYRKLTKKSCDVGDLSAVVTGMLLAFCLPVSIPLWIPVVGAFFAIVIVKQLYGGIGKNVVNPALAARVFLFVAFPAQLVAFTAPQKHLNAIKNTVSVPTDVLAGATPLTNLKNGTAPNEDIVSMLLGCLPGTIGEISVTLLLLGGIYLIFKKVITWHIPVSFIGTVAIITYLFPQGDIPGFEFMCYQLCSGGLILAAIFMATDYVTSPATAKGRIIYGVGCGLITVFIRYFGGYPEGVSFAVLIMNLFVWYLDKFTKPVRFGGAKKNEAKN